MREYQKINSVYKRDPKDGYKTMLVGAYSEPEFRFLKDCEWVFTEKVDGTNVRVIVDHGTITFKGKTDKAVLPEKLETRLHDLFDGHDKIHEMFPGAVCLYGEGYGAGIQKGGGNYSQIQDFVLFDVMVGEWMLRREDVELIGANLGIPVVPIVGRGSLNKMELLVREGMASTWHGDFLSEGIIAKPSVELKTRAGHRLITKLKTRDFDNWRQVSPLQAKELET